MTYLIWSLEHDAWWAPDRRGYTRDVSAAGVYDEAESREIVADANVVAFEECRIPVVCLGMTIIEAL